MTGSSVEVRAWRVHDTGLVAVPTRFRRLGGLVRHLRGEGDAWPREVTLVLMDAELRATGAQGAIGAWSRDAVTTTRQTTGPPVQFVLEVPGGSHLLAAAAGPQIDALLAALGGTSTS